MRIEYRVHTEYVDPDVFIICLYILERYIGVYYKRGYFEVDIGNSKKHVSFTIATEKAYLNMHGWGYLNEII